jgi:hypothetical protein
VKGLIADANVQGQVGYLVLRMQANAWADFWQALGLALYRFEDVGLSASSTDSEVWNVVHRTVSEEDEFASPVTLQCISPAVTTC